MGRYRGPRNKIARREEEDLELKTTGSSSHRQLLKRLGIPPGQHGQKRRRRRVSDYGQQLREKQKVKRMYGLYEKQFKKYFDIARKELGNTGEALMSLLERRLDNVLYKLNLAPTRAAARQYIVHGHVLVNGKKVDIPSFLVEEDMVITLKDTILDTPVVKKLLQEKDPNIVSWLERKGPVGRVARLPKGEDITKDLDVSLIIEFYSR